METKRGAPDRAVGILAAAARQTGRWVVAHEVKEGAKRAGKDPRIGVQEVDERRPRKRGQCGSERGIVREGESTVAAERHWLGPVEMRIARWLGARRPLGLRARMR